MASAQTIDIVSLLTPIAGENPAGGPSDSTTDTYKQIEDARKADDGLDQGVWQSERKTADWGRVITLATDALVNKGKDLQVVIRLIEALVKVYGFPGLRDGLRLLRECQLQFWSSLHPLPYDEGDYEDRAARIVSLNINLPVAIRAVPLTAASSRGDTYSWLRWQESRATDQLARQNAEAHKAALEAGKISGEDFDKAVATTPRAYYETRAADLAECRTECEQLIQVTDEKFGQDAPSLRDIRSAIDDCYTLLDGIVKKKREAEPDPAPPPETPPGLGESDSGAVLGGTSRPHTEPLPSGGAHAVTSHIQDRENALRRLEEVAEYFRMTEPHSPVTDLVKRAVRWGRMPLQDWLKEVLAGNNAALDQIMQIIGPAKIEGQGDGGSRE